MIDLYGLGDLLDGGKKQNETPEEIVTSIENNFVDEFPNPRFVPYIQLHEFEALIFVDLRQIKVAFPDEQIDDVINSLNSNAGKTEPEEINDGNDTSSLNRIIAAIQSYENSKSSSGPQIVHAIELPKLRERCAHFNRWVTILEQLRSV